MMNGNGSVPIARSFGNRSQGLPNRITVAYPSLPAAFPVVIAVLLSTVVQAGPGTAQQPMSTAEREMVARSLQEEAAVLYSGDAPDGKVLAGMRWETAADLFAANANRFEAANNWINAAASYRAAGEREAAYEPLELALAALLSSDLRDPADPMFAWGPVTELERNSLLARLTYEVEAVERELANLPPVPAVVQSTPPGIPVVYRRFIEMGAPGLNAVTNTTLSLTPALYVFEATFPDGRVVVHNAGCWTRCEVDLR